MALYWNEKHEQLVRSWFSADTRNQYYIYNKLHSAVYQMASVILLRYYYKYDDVKVMEAISDLYCNLHNYNPSKGKAFSFCQTVIKNYYYKQYMPNKLHILDLTYTDELPEVEYNHKDNDDDELQFQLGITKLEKAKSLLEFKLKTYKGKSGKVLHALFHEYEILINLIIYIKEFKYTKSDIVAILENIAIRTNLSEGIVRKYMMKYLKVSAKPYYDSQSKIEERYRKLGMLDEDHCGSAWHIGNKRKRLLKYKTFQTF